MKSSLSGTIRCYLAIVITLGFLVAAEAVAHWRCDDIVKFGVYLLFACIAGALKVRLPGMTGTYSLTFLFILIGFFELSFSETVIIAAVSMMVQSGCRTATKPRPLRIAFNAASCSLAAAAAYSVARATANVTFIVPLVLSALTYFMVNTFLVSVVLAHTEQERVRDIWSNWFRLSTVYYLTGSALAGVMIASNRYFGWMFSLLVFPLMYLEYHFYRLKIANEASKAERERAG